MLAVGRLLHSRRLTRKGLRMCDLQGIQLKTQKAYEKISLVLHYLCSVLTLWFGDFILILLKGINRTTTQHKVILKKIIKMWKTADILKAVETADLATVAEQLHWRLHRILLLQCKSSTRKSARVNQAGNCAQGLTQTSVWHIEYRSKIKPARGMRRLFPLSKGHGFLSTPGYRHRNNR